MTYKYIIGATLGFLLVFTNLSVVQAAPGSPSGGGDFGAFGAGIPNPDIGGKGDFSGIIGGGDVPPASGRSGSPDRSDRPAPNYACTPDSVAGGRNCIPLLAPLGYTNTIDTVANGPVGIFQEYFEAALPLIRIISIGFCVLWILIGSFFFMISGSDGGKRTKGKEIITWAIIGLIITEFAAFFLKTLNSVFFV